MKTSKEPSEIEVMVQISAGVWLHGVNVERNGQTDFNPCRLILDLDGGHERIYTVDDFIEGGGDE